MVAKVRINLANGQERLELPGLGPEQAEAIVRVRSDHGPIHDPGQLAAILEGWRGSDAIWEQADVSPSDTTGRAGARQPARSSQRLSAFAICSRWVLSPMEPIAGESRRAESVRTWCARTSEEAGNPPAPAGSSTSVG